jgi:isoquinoline 1-oxidoreductase
MSRHDLSPLEQQQAGRTTLDALSSVDQQQTAETSLDVLPSDEIELERYELRQPPAYHFELERRDFFKVMGGGLVVLFLVRGRASAQESGRNRRGGQGGQSLPQDIGSWLHIGDDGTVTAFTGKVEVGQGARTSLAQVVAEELRIPAGSVKMIMGDTDLTPYDMGTFGSMTTPRMAPQLRKVAAAAREALIDLAAERLKTDRASIVVDGGKAQVKGTSKQVAFGELARGQKLTRTVSDDAPTTPAEKWKVEGTSVPKADGRAIVTGQHKYTPDVKLPGMMYGRVLRPPSFGATLSGGNIDAPVAAAMTGVKVVTDTNFVGVVAPDQHTASQVIESIKLEWKTTPQISNHELFDYLRKTANTSQRGGQRAGGEEREGASGGAEAGSVEQALAAADHKLQSTYTIAYIAHAPLEPRAAVADWKDGKLTVWTGTQRPFGVKSELIEAFHLSPDKVRVIVPDTGSGYGGKHTGEVAIEAARLARSAEAPVKVIWTREEEFTWAYFRPAGVIDIKSGVSADGKITAWDFHNYNSGGSAIQTLYDIPNKRNEFHQTSSPLKQGSYRGLAATANHFARESHMDELAHAVKMDPLEFRLKNLKDERLRAVFEAAAKKFGWGGKPAPGHGFGIGGGMEKGGYVATCAEVAVDKPSGNVKILRVVTAWDSGAVLNPDNLKNQIEGSNVMAIGGALFEAIEFENGKILNPHFKQYRVPRLSDTPSIEVVLIDRKDKPSAGAGETAIVGLAPAVGNAIFQASGVRLRSLPMAPNGINGAAEAKG